VTRAERQALYFLSGIALLGGAVRAWRGVGEGEAPPPAARRALDAQLAAVDSAIVAERREREEREARRAARRAGKAPARGPPPAPAVVDVDRASAAELETLPRIGPALARRVVADRDSLGPFGSLEGLQRVRGIGPAMAAALAGRVTFSGTPRHLGAAEPPSGATSPARARTGRRRAPP
jgi:competence protein ComEA